MTEENVRLAIDTNVFVHLLNPEKNQASHIDHLLAHLLKLNPLLCEDSGGRIAAEYEQKLGHIVASGDDIGIGRILLSHWLQSVPRCGVDLNAQPALIKVLKAIIHEQTEGIDRTFVAVACLSNCPLITNDVQHISSRASILRKKTKQWHSGQFRCLTTIEARDELVK